MNIKHSESDDGWIMRLHEISGQSSAAVLCSDVFRFESARLTDGVERELGTNVLAGDGLQIVFEPYSFKTVRIHASMKSSSIQDKSGPNLVFDVFPNFPNPFNGVTEILVSLPKSCALEVSVYNATGQKVRTLWKGAKNEGSHVFGWDGYDDQSRVLASGVYVAKVATPDRVKTVKMILMR